MFTQVGDGERLWVSEYRVDVGRVLPKENGLKIYYTTSGTSIKHLKFDILYSSHLLLPRE